MNSPGGFPHFTPEEIAEDYDVPLETVAASMLKAPLSAAERDPKLKIKMKIE